MVFMVSHWSACLFHLAPYFSDSDETWLSLMGLDGAPPGDQYMVSIYWAVLMVVGIGAGEIVPQSMTERMVALVCVATGGSVYAYVVGSVASVLGTSGQATRIFHQSMDHLNEFMESKRLPLEMRRRVREYFIHSKAIHRERFYSQNLELMSPLLRGEVDDQGTGGHGLNHLPGHQEWGFFPGNKGRGDDGV